MSGAFPEDMRALDVWASAHVEDFRGPSRASKFATGQSNPTYLVEAASGRYVLRRKPPGKLLKSAHMIEREFRVLKALEVIDQAVQMHGGAGVSQDFPLARMWTQVRTLRLADGPDAVHRRVVAKDEMKRYSNETPAR